MPRFDSKTLAYAALGIGGGLLAYKVVRKFTERSLRGCVVLVTGGSRGFGLQLAREFAAEGAKLAICARDPQELQAVEAELRGSGAEVLTVPCDVGDEAAVRRLVDRVNDRYGQIDVLVNNAGAISVGPVDHLRKPDFEKAMEVNFYGLLHTILEVLPQMRNRGQGAIVNVTSIGGKVAMPHLLPYSCAKFAGTALSEGLHAELAGDGIHVLTVVPGLMRTGSFVNAEFVGDVEAEAEWFSRGELGLTAMDPKRAARQVVAALKRGDAEVILTAGAQAMARLAGAMPNATQKAASLVNDWVLPEPVREGQRATGEQLVEQGSPTLTSLRDRHQDTGREYRQPGF